MCSPVSLGAVSRRLSGLPAIFQSLGSLSATSFGGSNLAAASANLPQGVGGPGGPGGEPPCGCRAFRCGHFPLVGGSRNQHGARSGAGLAYILVRFADGAASGRKLTTPHTVAREVLPGSRKFGRDLQPVAFQLL